MNNLIFVASKGAHPEVIEYLERRYTILYLPLNRKCYERIQHHVDIQMLRVNNQIFMDSFTYDALKEEIMQLGGVIINELAVDIYYNGYIFHRISSDLGNKYPKSIVFNGKWNGTVFVHNLKYTNQKILDYLETTSIQKIHTKQGYAGCSLLLLNDRAGITADTGLAGELIKNGLDILLIRPGFIQLEGFDYGFIGGASFVANSKVVFNGDIDSHVDHEKIRAFIELYHFEVVSFEGLPLIDIGSYIAID